MLTNCARCIVYRCNCNMTKFLSKNQKIALEKKLNADKFSLKNINLQRNQITKVRILKDE